jgi:curved DNA-binding protein CbpA
LERKPLTEHELQELGRVQRLVQSGSHYEVLGVTISASKEEIDSGYHTFVRHWHPDRFFNRDLGDSQMLLDENFAAVTRAFRTLRDPAQRLAYDRELRAREPAPSVPPRPAASRLGSLPPFRAPTSPPVSPAPPGSATGQASSVPSRAPGTLPPRAPGMMSAQGTLPPRPPGAGMMSAQASMPPRSPRVESPVERLRGQLAAQVVQARTYFEAGKKDFDEGSWKKAESNLYLATRYDPQNEAYQELHKKAVTVGRQARAVQYVAAAETAETYGQAAEAEANYRKAVELDPPDGKAFYKLGKILRAKDDENRAAVEMYRKAVAKDPKNVEYAVALAELYDVIGLKENARRLVGTALTLDKNHVGAKALARKLRD